LVSIFSSSGNNFHQNERE
jgi:hypothetical protein